MKANGTVNGYPAFRDDDGNISMGPHIECPHCGRHDCFRPGEDGPNEARGACSCPVCGDDITKPPSGVCSRPANHPRPAKCTRCGATFDAGDVEDMTLCAPCLIASIKGVHV